MRKTLLYFILCIMPMLLNAQTQIGNDIDGEAAGDLCGSSVSLSSDGTIMAVGSRRNDGNGTWSGHVRVYEWDGSAWIQMGNDIDGEAVTDESGRSISLSSSGTILAIGASSNDGINGNNSGHVRVYEWDGSAWVQIGNDIDGEEMLDASGWSVSLSSNGAILAIGAVFNSSPSGNFSGHVRVYEWDGTSWIQMGSDIDGEGTSEIIGSSVSLSSNGTIVAIGGNNLIRMYEWDGSTWAKLGNDINSEVAGDSSGQSISLSSDGTIVTTGARMNDGNGTNAGHVRVFEWDGSAWVQMGNDIDGESAGDQFGSSVSLSSDGLILAAGASFNDGVNGFDRGHTRIFHWDGLTWIQVGNDIDGEADSDNSGSSVFLSLDGTNLVIGATENQGNGVDAGHVRVYDTGTMVTIPVCNAPVDLFSGLIAHYPINGNANDESGNGFNGVNSGGTLTTDRFSSLNSAYDFFDFDFININSISTTLNSLVDFSFSAWFKTSDIPVSDSDNIIFSANTDAPASGIENALRFGTAINGGIYIADQNNQSHVLGSGFHDGMSHHLAVTVEASGATIVYVDSTLVGEVTLSPINWIDVTAAQISGELDGGQISDTFLGVIDDVRIYDRIINCGEIDSLYNEGCFNNNLVQNQIIDVNTTLFATNSLELDSVVVNSPYDLIIKSPEVFITNDSEIKQGATLCTIDEEVCFDN